MVYHPKTKVQRPKGLALLSWGGKNFYTYHILTFLAYFTKSCLWLKLFADIKHDFHSFFHFLNMHSYRIHLSASRSLVL